MTQCDILLSAICADPTDDLARLAYADWCEETGDDERAQFIRDGIAICEPEKLNPHYDMGSEWDGVIDTRVQHPPSMPDHCELCRTITRLHRSPMIRSIPNSILDVALIPRGSPYVTVLCRQGFAHHVSIPIVQWMNSGPEIVSKHPIKRLELNDREPRDFASQLSHLWTDGGWRYIWDWRSRSWTAFASGLPTPIYEVLVRVCRGSANVSEEVLYFKDAMIAKSALGHAALMWARREAGLPEWEWELEQ